MSRHARATLPLLWDVLLVGLCAVATVALPDIFPWWMAVAATPLIACQARLSRLALCG